MVRRRFTLIELIVVMSIIALVSGLAVATLRGESPAQTLEKGALEFAAFCAGVRYRAIEEGVDWKVCFDPDTRFFFAAPDNPDDGTDTEENPETPETNPALPGRLRWKLPERFELDAAGLNQLAVGETPELFRFFGTGGAGGDGEFTLKCGTLSRRFSISKLSGTLTEERKEEE